MTTAPARSLQRRLLLLVVGGMVVVWMATAVATWVDVRHELDELLDSHLAQAAALLVVQQVREMEDDDEDGRGLDTPTLHRYAPKAVFQVWHEGRLAMRSANAPLVPLAGDGRALRSGFETLQIDGTDWRVFAAQGAERDVQVFVGEQMTSRSDILWAVLRSTLWPMAVALPVLALAAGWAVHRGVAPLRRLGQTLARRDPRALQPVVVRDVPSEMVPMIDALNGLFGRIGALMESERRFTSDAAHELRTPISAIRTQAQVALAEADDGLRRHALLATLQGCDRAVRLVEQLLTLSRLESGDLPAAARVDLTALARRTLADLAPGALARGQDVSLDAEPGLSVQGSDVLLAVLLRNLVDNALRYAGDGARVQVSLAARGGSVNLQVEDSGPGLADADMARLGERFFRVLGTGQDGSGLGWSIVRRIAQVHGALVAVQRSRALGGLSVSVRWPAAGSAGAAGAHGVAPTVPLA